MSNQCFGEGTRIMLYDEGYKRVEDVKKHDFFIGPNNTKCEIINTYTGSDFLYKIIDLDYNYVYTVTENHILTLINSNNEILNIKLKDFLDKKKKCIYYGFRVMVDYKNKNFTEEEINNYVDDIIEKIKNNEKINLFDDEFIFNTINIRSIFLSSLILKDNNYDLINGNIVFYLNINYVKLIDKILFLCFSLHLNPTTERVDNAIEITINTCTSDFFSYLQNKISDDYLDILEDDSVSTYNIKIVKEEKKNKYYGFETKENNRFILWDSSVSYSSTKN